MAFLDLDGLRRLVTKIKELVANMVTLDTAQNITAGKTFLNTDVGFNGGRMNFVNITSPAMRLNANNNNSSVDLIRVDKGGARWQLQVVIESNAFARVDFVGATRIVNMIDPTEDAHGANKRYVDTQISSVADRINDYISSPNVVTIATTTTAGLIKAGTSNGQVQVATDGTASVVGFNSLAKSSTTEDTYTLTVTQQNQKYFSLDFVQPTSGFRNYCHLQMRVRNGSNGTWATPFRVTTRNTKDAVYLIAETYFCFSNASSGAVRVSGIATPTDANDAVNKAYVDALEARIAELEARIQAL